jgi:ferredoxin
MNTGSQPTRRGFLAGRLGLKSVRAKSARAKFERTSSDRAAPVPEGPLHASINDGCLARQNIVCRSCADACGTQAIRFTLRVGGAALPVLTIQACNGCGDCVAACPASAITLANLLEDTHV